MFVSISNVYMICGKRGLKLNVTVFFLVFLYRCVSFACLAAMNFRIVLFNSRTAFMGIPRYPFLNISYTPHLKYCTVFAGNPENF